MDRRKFIKTIAGVAAATALPLPKTESYTSFLLPEELIELRTYQINIMEDYTTYIKQLVVGSIGLPPAALKIDKSKASRI